MNESSSRMTASEFVADTLRREIVRGELLPGQPLLQDHIASRFDVSQSSVREALRRLEAASLVYSVRHRGTFVSSLSPEQVREMYAIREAIELLALRHNFERFTPERLAEARQLLDAAESDREFALFGESNKKFHAMFYESEDLPLVRDILRNIFGNLTRLWVDFTRRRPGLARRHEEESRHGHRELLSAIGARDLAAAEAALIKHLRSARDLMIEHLEWSDKQALDSSVKRRKQVPGEK